jgi:hypothetical protein
MNCEDIRAMLEDASEAAKAEVAGHIRGCEACADYAARLSAENEVLSRALSTEPDEKRFQQVRAGVAREIASSKVTRQRQWIVWAASSAAAAVMAVGLAIYQFQSDSDELAMSVSRLQQSVREKQVLDELEQLQIAFKDSGDEDATSVAEDAELYVVRILSLDPSQSSASREILAGIKEAGISARLHQVRDSIIDEAPKPLLSSIELALSTLEEATRLSEKEERRHAH